MTKRRTLVFLVSMLIIIGAFPGGIVSFADQSEIDSYMNEVPDGDIAYCNFYGNLDSRYASFIDGVSLGIKDTRDPLYFEQVVLDGYEGRKQYGANTTYINVEDDFYEKDDHNFIVNIFYYDFGPLEGTYYLEYRTTGGGLAQKSIVKPGNYPGWTYISIVLEDCDLSPHYENGASLRIQNGAYNAWRRVEIVNISDCKTEKKDIEGVRHLGLRKRRDLEKTFIVEENKPIFMPINLAKPCTMYDVLQIKDHITMENSSIDESEKEKNLTQAELLKIFMDLVNLDYSNKESIVDFALETGFVESDGLFLFDEAKATNFNLGSLLNDFLDYEMPDGESFVFKMFNKGFFGDLTVNEIPNDALMADYYAAPRINPYITITDNSTKRTFKYINFYGEDLLRPYLTAPQWLHDGKRFICSTRSGYLYLYDIETQIMSFLAKSERKLSDNGDGIVGEDGMIYYHGREGALYTINRIDPNDPELKSKIVYRFPPGVVTLNETFAANGKWFAGDISDNSNYFKAPSGYAALVVFHIPEESVPGVPDETYQVGYYKFSEPEKGWLNHRQANPAYPNMIFFAHETDTSYCDYDAIRDRSNVMDLNTGEVWTYNQGYVKNGKNFDLTTHESFSADGEWLTGVTWVSGGAGHYMGQTDQQMVHAIFKARPDGSHRQLYFADDYGNNFNHTFFSSDMEWAVADSGFISLMCTDTHQLFPITSWSRNTLKGHPYHAHAQVARNKYIASWGHTYKGVLGVAWYDFTHIAEKEKAKGEKYNVNEYVDCVSYKNLECESERLTKDGRDCQVVKAGKAIYYEINPDIVDTTNDAIRITFDYLDNSTNSLVITYTGGVRNQNDDRKRFDKQIHFSRQGTGKWKQAVIEIEEANCESVGKYESDFTISGGSAKTYISNVKVEAMETYYKRENNFTDAGGTALLADPSVIFERIEK